LELLKLQISPRFIGIEMTKKRFFVQTLNNLKNNLKGNVNS